MYDKKAVFDFDGEGKVVGVREVHSFHDQSEFASFAKAAETQKELDENTAKALAEEKAKSDAAKSAEDNKTNYYAKWRLVYACDSILTDYLFGDASIDSESASEASAVKKSCLGEIVVKEALSSHPNIKRRFVGIFGEEP